MPEALENTIPEMPTAERVGQILQALASDFPDEARLLRAYLFASGHGEDPEARYIRMVMDVQRTAVQAESALRTVAQVVEDMSAVDAQVVRHLELLASLREREIAANERANELAGERVLDRKTALQMTRETVNAVWSNRYVQLGLGGLVFFVAQKLGVGDVMVRLLGGSP